MTHDLSRRSLLAGAGGALALSLTPSPAYADAWRSTLVYRRGERLVYGQDAEHNRVPDFSHAGYQGGERPIPHLPVVKTIGPVEGDNTAHIQAALDEVAALPIRRRGALLLRPGRYPVSGTIYVRSSRTVLRGSGDGDDPAFNTVILATAAGPADRTVIVAGGGGPIDWAAWRGEVPGTRTDITSDFVQVGARSFEVANAGGLRPGDNVVVFHPCSDAWLRAIDYGGHDTGRPWNVDEEPILYNRFVTDVSGNRVTVDAPVFNHLDRSLSQSYVYKTDGAGVVTEVGVERLRVDVEFDGDPFAAKSVMQNAIRIFRARDAWIRTCTALRFWQVGMEAWEATRVTIEDCRALEPTGSTSTGGNRYNFCAHPFAQNVLFKDCHASKARHAFIDNGAASSSGIVFLRGLSEETYNTSEGHRRWNTGLLFDGHRELNPHRALTLGLYNRGWWGTSHGWSAAHSVAWGCDMGGSQIVVQKPPTAQNYVVGARSATVNANGPFAQPVGHIEGTGETRLEIPSLYVAQLRQRGFQNA
ncbi:hypothetical protein SAMN05444920_12880 [Nonomuraea solani]|uniref:Pectate lyase superfamily protein n=1 Tax=Nonomuraea solani TaxID=1144553 RepID=A0A1H6EZ56_9ACTN|nr:peptidoglycan-binding protein [Nonomuraea solani]SEH02653.1 hypothetical protein SAMN05444920_12880 [Nonomuraea solani]